MELEKKTHHALILDFHDWLNDWDAIRDTDEMLSELRHSKEPLPEGYCDEYGLGLGSTYGDVAELFLSAWRPNPNTS